MQRLVNAKYGNGDNTFDVTHILRMLFKNNIYKITVNNDVFADDPAPKMKKELTIKFANGKYKKYAEGETFIMDPTTISFGMRLDQAKIDKLMSRFTDIYYGCSGNYMTSTEIIRNHLENGNTEIKINTINMHHDHCFGKVKDLLVIYADGHTLKLAYGNTFHVDGHRTIFKSAVKNVYVTYDRRMYDITDYLKKQTKINSSELIEQANKNCDTKFDINDSVVKIIAVNGDIYTFPSNYDIALAN